MYRRTSASACSGLRQNGRPGGAVELRGPTASHLPLTAAASPTDELEILLRFCSVMLRSGNTAARTREAAAALARSLGLEEISVSISFDAIALSVRRSGTWTTRTLEVGPPRVDAWRIGELGQLSRTDLGLSRREIAEKLNKIEAAKFQYSEIQIVAAIGVASAGFAYLNAAPPIDVIAAAIGGCIGQSFRSWVSRFRLNQYGIVALSAVAAASASVGGLALARWFGLRVADYPVGVMASVLFLVPGFPAIAALFDLLQGQTVAAVSRFAYAVMIMVALAFGLSIVIAIAGTAPLPPPADSGIDSIKMLLRGVSSFVAAAAFAMLFNSPARLALLAGALAAAANSVRLLSMDAGLSAVPAAFAAAILIGAVALLAETRLKTPPLTMTVAPIIIMVPGMQAFQALTFFDQDRILEAVEAFGSFSFGVSALALGLATAQLFKPAYRTVTTSSVR